MIKNYYQNILDIQSSSLSAKINNSNNNNNNNNDNDDDENIIAFKKLSEDIILVIKDSFTFDQNPEHGIVGDWHKIFLKIID